MVTKKDCFAYREKFGRPDCLALEKHHSKCEGCHFYKTLQKAKADVQKAMDRHREIGFTNPYEVPVWYHAKTDF